MSNPKPRGVECPRAVEVLSIKEGKSYLVKFLAGYLGTEIHWTGERYVPCAGAGLCPTKTHEKRTLWRGWSPVLMHDQLSALWWPMVLEITESLEEQLRGRQLRGETWSLTRPKTKKAGNPVVAICLDRVEESAVPPVFDIVPVLLRVYHVATIDLGRANPTPPKLIMQGVSAPVPELWAELQEKPEEVPSPEQQAEMRAKLKAALASFGGKVPGPTNGKKGGENRG